MASWTPLPTGAAGAVGCSAIDEGDDTGEFERCRAVIAGTDGKGCVAPDEGYLFSEAEVDDRLSWTENHLSFSCLESRTSHTTVDEDAGIMEFETREAAVSAVDDTTGLALDERYMLSAADDDDGVLRAGEGHPSSEPRTSQGLRSPP